MPFAEFSGFKLHYSLHVSANPNAPLLIFSNSLGATLNMWDPQASALAEQFCILRYDTRGHGQSSVTPGPYSIAHLAKDVLDLLDFLHLDRAHFCGLSMGGMTGMWLAVNAPDRLHKLVLANTAAKIGTTEGWNARIHAIQTGGMTSVVSPVIERWFTPAFRQQNPAAVAPAQRMLENANPEGYIANCAAVRDFDFRETLSAIHTPTLVISGTHDLATAPAEGQFLAHTIPAARYVELPAAHISNIEAASQFTAALVSFLTS
jgi:3-oxoadipate enol-lactonase